MTGIGLAALALATLFFIVAALRLASRRWPSAGAVAAGIVAGVLLLFLVGSILTGNFLQSGDRPVDEADDCRGVRSC